MAFFGRDVFEIFEKVVYGDGLVLEVAVKPFFDCPVWHVEHEQ